MELDLIGVRVALLEVLPVAVALLNNLLGKGGVLVVVADDSVGAVTLDDFVVLLQRQQSQIVGRGWRPTMNQL